MSEQREPQQNLYRPSTWTAVIGALVGLLSMIIIVAVMVWVGRPAPPPTEPPVPRRTLEEVRAEEQAALETYGWIDREQGIVRIPIERAMEKLIEETRMTNHE